MNVEVQLGKATRVISKHVATQGSYNDYLLSLITPQDITVDQTALDYPLPERTLSSGAISLSQGLTGVAAMQVSKVEVQANDNDRQANLRITVELGKATRVIDKRVPLGHSIAESVLRDFEATNVQYFETAPSYEPEPTS